MLPALIFTAVAVVSDSQAKPVGSIDGLFFVWKS